MNINLINQKELEILKIELKIKKLELEIFNDLDFECFLAIDGYDNYFISNFGNVKNSKTNKILKHSNHRQGYKEIHLCKNGKRKIFKIHRLVAIAFLENPDNKPKVDHIDENKADNNVKNLRWATNQENGFNINKQSNNKSGFKGVSLRKDINKYGACINIDGKNKSLGYYETAEEASKAYEAKAEQLHGEFYYKNK